MSVARRGAVTILVAMFAASGVLRLGDGLGVSLARAAGDALTPTPEGAGMPDPAACTPPAALAAALSEREAQVLAREIALEDRAAAIALAEEVMRGRVEALTRAEADLRGTLALADGAAEADLARLTAVYEAMKPRDTATLFNAMEPDFAAGFLGRMRPDAAAAVLAGMDPERAYAASAVLAGRNANVPTE